MNEQQLFLLKDHRKDFRNDLSPEDVFSYLRSKFVLDEEDVELIKYEKTRRRRTVKLLEILRKKNADAFGHFHDALNDVGGGYKHLADLLKSEIGTTDAGSIGDAGTTDNSAEYSAEALIRNGGVPQKPHIHISRQKFASKLKKALFGLKEKDGWVLLHGMAGSGKSVLAADVLHDEKLVLDCFPGGVFWLTMKSVDDSKLLIKMANLACQLDPDKTHPAPRNLEEAKDRIRILFSQEQPRSLLVLDDLWNQDYAKYFDVRVRTLVTSRVATVTENIRGSVSKVELNEGFTEEQSKTVLAKWIGIDEASLHDRANEIIDSCKGLPLAISMIGALLKCHPNRWEYYIKQLEESKVQKIKTRLAYDYPNLSDAIAISVDSLPEDIKDKYLKLATFDKVNRIPTRVLQLIWDEEDEIEVEDIMDEIISRSLAKRHSTTDDAYCIHDLQLDYLKEIQSDSLVELHKLLVDKYSQRCQGNFASLKDDSYVYWQLLNHMISADMVDQAVALLLDFGWINSKLVATGAPDLIYNYQNVSKHVKNEQDKEKLDSFCHFISVNCFLLSAPGKQEYNLLQLALGHPFPDDIQLMARERARKCLSKDNFYLEWSNKPKNTSEACLLTVKHHSDGVRCCHFAQDNTERIVSCGEDSKIMIWDSITGKELVSLEGHTDTVFCCCFSPDGKLVASSSADNTVKIWNADNGLPKQTIKGHSDDVLCCTFSPNGELLASCSCDGTLALWDIKSGVLQNSPIGHDEGVNWCCFSPDGKRIASASNDKSVKIWDVKSAKCLSTCNDFDDFVRFCIFHPSGTHIAAASQHYLKRIDASNGEVLRSVQTPSSILSVAFSPDGVFAVGAHADAKAQLWNVDVMTCMGVFPGHASWLYSVCYSPDGKKIVTASEDKTCKRMSYAGGQINLGGGGGVGLVIAGGVERPENRSCHFVQPVWKAEPAPECVLKLRKVFDVRFDLKCGPLIVAANTGNEIQVFNGSNGCQLRKSACLGSRITVCKFSIDGTKIIIGLKSGCVKVLGTASCDEKHSLFCHDASIRDLFLDGMAIITCSEDKTIKVWDLDKRLKKAECQGHKDTVTHCKLFKNDSRIVSSSADASLKVWDIADGECLFTCSHEDQNTVLSCEVSADDKFLVSSSAGSMAKLWNANTGQLLHTLEGHQDCVRCAAFSSDCKMVATGSDDGTVKVWSTETGEEIAACERHNVWVTDIHFSPDNSMLLSVSDDIKWWKADGSLVQSFRIRGNFLRQIKISSDFQRFITIDDSGQLIILNALH
eukprot:gene18164-19977_t